MQLSRLLPKCFGNYFRKFRWRNFRSRPGKPNQRKGQNEKFMNFAHFCEFWCFSLGKQARFILNFCSGMPLRKVHELTFLWFGLPGPLLRITEPKSFSGTKKEHKPKLVSPDTFRWSGGLPCEGVGAKEFGMSLKTREIKLFWRDIPGFCRDIPGAPEKFEKKVSVQFSSPMFWNEFGTVLVCNGKVCLMLHM